MLSFCLQGCLDLETDLSMDLTDFCIIFLNNLVLPWLAGTDCVLCLVNLGMSHWKKDIEVDLGLLKVRKFAL